MDVYRDSANGVTCWSMGGNTLSCLPDWMLKNPVQARTDAAWPPSPHEQQPEPTPALAPGRWIDERYEL
nr:hypothetical protein [Pseudomonas sp. S32]